MGRSLHRAVGVGTKLLQPTTQQGTKALQGVKFGAGIVTTGLGAENTSWMGAGKTVVGVAGLVPVLGQAAAAVSIVLDGVQAGLEIAKCY